MHAMRTHVRPSGTRYPNAHPTGHEFGRDWPGRRRVSCQATAWRASGTRLSTSARVRSIWQKSCDDSVQPAIRNAQVSPRKPTVAIVGAVDVVRFGLSVRALRRRRRWRQLDLADRAGVSRAAISRIERGRADRLTLRTLNQIADPLVARIDVRLLWNGEGLDRLLDEEHAGLVEAVIRELEAARWEPATEVSFSIRGERGSVDVLAFHPATSTLLVVEVKSVVPDLQAMLATLDRKTRLAGAIGRERSWAATHTGRLLVVRDDRTARRRIASHEATFAGAFPVRGWAVRRWLRDPTFAPDVDRQRSAGRPAFSGLLFLPIARQAGARHRVAAPARRLSTGSRTEHVGADIAEDVSSAT